MAESIVLGSLIISGGGAKNILCATSSHFCSAEKQFRTPLEYGGQRTPNAQWTVTGSGAVVLGSAQYEAQNGQRQVVVRGATTGKIVDYGVKDAFNMGGAMAPAAADVLLAHFRDFDRKPSDYDCIYTGDLGYYGGQLLQKLLFPFQPDQVPVK